MRDDQCRGALTDRQPSPGPVRLVVVIDQHRLPVLVAGQTVEVQLADLLRPAAGVDGQLNSGAHHQRGQLVQVSAELPHDLRGQVP